MPVTDSAAGSASERGTLIVADLPIEGIWTQLSLWESQALAAKLLRTKAEGLRDAPNDAKIQRKAASLAYCLRNAREYLRGGQSAITSRVVANYYGCMWLASAILVANPSNDYDLEKLESVTKSGHGLGNIADDRQAFPDNEFVYVRESGFFPEFLKAQGLSRADLAAVKIAGAPVREVTGLDPDRASRLISIIDILARIPELKGTFEYVTDRPALSFGVAYASFNYQEDPEKLEGIANLFGEVRQGREHTWVSLTEVKHLDQRFIEENGPPLTDYQLRTFAGSTAWEGKLAHPADQLWWSSIKHYKSAMCGTSWVKPLLGHIDDMFSLNLMMLYELSILARYRPAVWRQIIEGSLDQYRALIEAYNQVVDRVIPELALQGISGQRVTATTAGSMFAPV
ncbi:hypothetical protein MPPM_5538 (plasmid) [Methylorubrum populi]|uniref:Uncharacterized protein n=1 Tax=Methylorubrum populi TaxID=223967 RepID=A0A160PMY1_9HYPH|nr:hypothetical protein [Methylorubrum populi]BAU94143.1 hypothetical protein MPPM_5538 [Methylorubrum populi]